MLKASMVGRLANSLGGPEHLALIERRLSPRQWRALAYPALKEGPVMLSAMRLLLEMQGGSTDQIEHDLRGLILTGCLIIVDRLRTGHRLQPDQADLSRYDYRSLPVVAFPGIFDLAQRKAAGYDVLGWQHELPPEVRLATSIEAQREAYLLLRGAMNGQLRLTVKGVPFKADIAKLAAQSRRDSQLGKGSRKGRSADKNPRLWLLAATLLAAELIRDERRLARASGSAAGFLEASLHEQMSQLYDGWLACPFSEFLQIPDLEVSTRADRDTSWVEMTDTSSGIDDVPIWSDLRAARQAIAEAIRRGATLSESEWLALSALGTSIRIENPTFLIPTPSRVSTYQALFYGQDGYSRNPDNYRGIRRRGQPYTSSLLKREVDWHEVEGAYIEQVLRGPLFWLGLIDLGENTDGKLTSIRLTALGRHVLLGEPLADEPKPAAGSPNLIVQPNFDLVVMDAPSNLALLAKIDQFAEQRLLDRAATYRMTRQSVVQGLERGLTADSILATLEGASQEAIPQNVRYSVEDWARLFDRFHIRRTAILMVADTPEQLKSWLAQPNLARYLSHQLSPTAALVPARRRRAFERIIGTQNDIIRTIDYRRPAQNAFRVVEPALIELVPERDEPYVRYRLGRFADTLVRSDAPVRFEITPESIRRAKEVGLTPDDIITYLRRTAIPRLPADTLLRIRGWADQYGPVRHQTALVAELPHGLVWTDLQGIAAVKSAVLRLIGSKIALVDPGQFENLRVALAERGLRLETGLADDVGAQEMPLGSGRQLNPSLLRGLDETPIATDSLSEIETTIMRALMGRLSHRDYLNDDIDADMEADLDEEEEFEDEDVPALPPGTISRDQVRQILARAVNSGSRVAIQLTDSDGDPYMIEISPEEMGAENGRVYVVGSCQECHEHHRVFVDEIRAIGVK